MHVHPERLGRDAFSVTASVPRIFRHELRKPVDVHWHEFYELLFVVDGEGHHAVNGQHHAMAAGSAFLLTPADFHGIVPSDTRPLTCFNVIFNPAMLENVDVLMPPARERIVQTATEFWESADEFGQLWDESGRDRPGRELVLESTLRCILVKLIRRCSQDVADTAASRRPIDTTVRRAILYIDHHFRAPLTLAAVAAQACLSPNYFSEQFHEATGRSFQTYLQDQRLGFASALLATTDLGVAEICHAAGFNNLSHFGRAYRRRYGKPPSACRKS